MEKPDKEPLILKYHRMLIEKEYNWHVHLDHFQSSLETEKLFELKNLMK
jgi:hypothetical protein